MRAVCKIHKADSNKVVVVDIKPLKVCNNSCLTLRALERRLLSLANNNLKLRGNVEIRDTNE